MLLLSSYHLCPLLCISINGMYLDISSFLKKKNLQSFPFYCFPLLLCIVHLRKFSYISLIFSGILHSVGYIFPFLPCLSLPFLPQIFIKSPHTATFLLVFFFELLLITASFIRLGTSVHSFPGTLLNSFDPLNIFITFTV